MVIQVNFFNVVKLSLYEGFAYCFIQSKMYFFTRNKNILSYTNEKK